MFRVILWDLLILSSVHCFGGAVLWDVNHGVGDNGKFRPSLTSGYYQNLVGDLKQNGIAVNSSTLGLLNEDLTNVDVVVISSFCSVSSAYSSQEADKVAEFVAGGGGLLILGDQHSSYLNIQNIASRFGMSFGMSMLYPYDVYTTDLASSHPIFAGVDSLYLYAATEVTGGNPLVYEATTKTPVGSLAFYGKGRIIAVGDNSLWLVQPQISNYTQEDNALFAKNVFTYLGDRTIVPEPASLLLLAAGLSSSRKRKQDNG